MARQQKKYHYIYKTTCNVTNRYYIGMHSTDDLDDGYIGSGKQLWHSINYHSRDEHSIEILEFLPNRESLKKRESEIVTEELLSDDMCMNLVLGGEGGWHRFANEGFMRKMNTDPEFRKRFSERMTEQNHKWWSEGMFEVNGFYGKKHTEETKKKISESQKGISKGKADTNSQYGTCWITKDGEDKKVSKSHMYDYISEGWTKGRSNYVKPPTNTKLGTSNGNSKLNEEKVLGIKRLIGEGLSSSKIAIRYGVSRPTIDNIKKGKTWTHLELS